MHIYRATRGKYIKPILLSKAKLKWVDDDYNKIKIPKKQPCGHPKHWEWGRGTRNGQKLWFSTTEMFFQKYHLTKKELQEAVKQYDMASIEMQSRIICRECAERELSTSQASVLAKRS